MASARSPRGVLAVGVAMGLAFVACTVKHDVSHGLPESNGGTGAYGAGPGCDPNGDHYDEGQSFPADCNTCTCEHGSFLCTTKICGSAGDSDGGRSGEASAGAINGGQPGEPGAAGPDNGGQSGESNSTGTSGEGGMAGLSGSPGS